MILSYGTEEFTEHKRKIVRYKFFRDGHHGGRDAVYGIDQSLNHLVDTFKAAARNYGPERRVILLHGPVGSAKSTIVRLLKKGLEEYSRTADGAMYTFGWTNVTREIEKEMYQVTNDELVFPMREDALHLFRIEQRNYFLAKLLESRSKHNYSILIEVDLCTA